MILNTTPKIVGIIQARMGSKRFPGKMTALLKGYSIIEWVIRRTKKSKFLDHIVLATSKMEENDCLVKIAKNYDIYTYRGSEDDVLSRFVEVGNFTNAESIVRICADNPLIHWMEIDRLINFFLTRKPDYAFNHIPKFGNNYINGIGAEILSLEILNEVNKRASTPQHREHVTQYLWDNFEKYKILTFPAPREYAHPFLKLDIDNQDDLKLIEKNMSKNLIDMIVPEEYDILNIISLLQDNYSISSPYES